MKFGLTMVLTPDLAEAERFYGEALGLTLTAKTANQLVFGLEGSEFHVFQCAEPAPEHRHAAVAATVCVFEVASIDDAMAELKAKDVVFIHQRPAENPLSGARYAAFKAPGGNVHEIMERRAGSAGGG